MTLGLLAVERIEDGIRITRADPEIAVADEFLEHLRHGDCLPGVTLGDGILTVRAINGTVSYGLCDYDLERMWWRGVKSA